MTQPSAEFKAMSARLGQDPLRVQGAGGNTSIKVGDVMWIKASGTELANAETQDIFVAVDRAAAVRQAHGEGDGTCKDTVLDPANTLRPSIETTFHAALDWTVVAHTHSVATIVHAICPEGSRAAQEKLADLNTVVVPYAKPGLPLTQQILARVTPQTQVIILQNHGLICCGDTVAQVSRLMDQVERALALPTVRHPAPNGPELHGFERLPCSWLAFDSRLSALATTGTYYPDHVVFLGPALPVTDHDGTPPVVFAPGKGVYLRNGATSSQRAMITCLADCLARLPQDWTPTPIGAAAEAELLNWDAEKYRQALAARS